MPFRFRDRVRDRLRTLGPGLVLAAAGIGAGDVIVASVTGMKFGTTLLWAIVVTVALKYVLTEALARWQLATGETVVRAWVTRLPRWVGGLFAAYLLFWTFMVGASLSGACGVAAASLWPALTVGQWGALHAVFAAGLVALNRYAGFQRMMKLLVALMAVCVVICAGLAAPSLREVGRGLVIPRVPQPGGTAQVLALLGGIGGSVTVICYGYWMRAAGWTGAARLGTVRSDVGLAYLFTALFGIALVAIAAGVDAVGGAGARIALEIAARLGTIAGPLARGLFLAGFWCTVFTAMLGVWQGVPQIYVDWVDAWRARRERGAAGPVHAPMHGEANVAVSRPVPRERGVFLLALAYLAGPPLVLLWFKEPVQVVVMFSIAGAFFMPFLAGTLLYLNNRREWMGPLANRGRGNAALAACLVAFGAVCVSELLRVSR